MCVCRCSFAANSPSRIFRRCWPICPPVTLRGLLLSARARLTSSTHISSCRLARGTCAAPIARHSQRAVGARRRFVRSQQSELTASSCPAARAHPVSCGARMCWSDSRAILGARRILRRPSPCRPNSRSASRGRRGRRRNAPSSVFPTMPSSWLPSAEWWRARQLRQLVQALRCWRSLVLCLIVGDGPEATPVRRAAAVVAASRIRSCSVR